MKMYLQTKTGDQIVAQYDSGYKSKAIKEFQSSSLTSMELIMDYMLKHINTIDEARKEIRIKNPGFLPEL